MVYALALGGYVLSELFEPANAPQSVLAMVVLVAIVFLVVERWRGARVAERRTLVPVLWAGPPVLVVAAVSTRKASAIAV
jgi:hypothetical protein